MKTLAECFGKTRCALKSFLESGLVLVLGWMVVFPCFGQSTVTNVITGMIAVPGQRDSYTFSVASTTRFYFDSLTNVSSLQWSLSGPQGALVQGRSFSGSDAQSVNDPTVSLPAGNYILTIQDPGAQTSGYAFRFVNLAEATLLTPGAPVTNSLSPADKSDFYQFTASAGDSFFFQQISRVGLANTWWRLMDPYGNQVFSQSFNNVGTALAPVILPAAGTYTLLLEGYIGDSGSGTYAFNVVPEGNVPPVPFTGTPMNLGDLIVSNLTANTTNAYIFTLASSAQLIFDSQTNSPNLNWTLQGPQGVVVDRRGLNQSDGNYGFGALNLPAGNYQLLVRGNANNPYQFRLFDASTATPLTPGVAVNSTLNPASATTAYQFAIATAGRFFFNYQSSSGLGSPYWELVDPYGTILFNSYLGNDQGPLTLTNLGNYLLLVEGYVTDTGSGNYSFTVVPVSNGLQALTLGSVTTGAIAAPGQQQQYTFTLPSAARLYFDSLTNNSNLRWSLDGPTGNVINGRSFTGSDSQSQGNPVLALASGNYTLTVFATADNTSGYQFNLFDLAAAASLTLGAPVNATLNPANSTTAYQFTLGSPGIIFYNFQSSSGLPDTYVRLVDAYGNFVMSTSLSTGQGPLALAAGTYTLLVEGYIYDTGSGNYSFTVVPVSNGLQALTLGSVTSGAITAPGQLQQYTFTLASTARLYFDSLTNNSNLRWSLDGPKGNVINGRSFTGSDAQNQGNPVLALPPGNYTLTVFATANYTSGYQFNLFDLATAAPLTVGAPVNATLNPANSTTAYQFTLGSPGIIFYNYQSSSGLPNTYVRLVDAYGNFVMSTYLSTGQGPLALGAGTYTLLVEGYIGDTGSGNYSFTVVPVSNGLQALTLGSVTSGAITAPGQLQQYTFTLPSTARLYFDSLTNNSNLRWSLDGPKGNVINGRSFTASDAQSQGNPVLALSPGNYTLTVFATVNNTSGYQFELFDLATAAPLTLGTPVNATLNPANSTTAYQFTLGSPGIIFYNFQSSGGLPSTYLRLVDAYGNFLISTSLGNDQGPLALGAGTYTLLVEGYIGDTGSGNYSFTVVPVSNGLQALTLGSITTGAITTPGQLQQYTFTLPPGARLFFDALTNTCAFNWRLDGPTGNLLGGNNTQCLGTDWVQPRQITPVPAGDYTLTISAGANNAAMGPFVFRLYNMSGASELSFDFTGDLTPPPPPVAKLQTGWPANGVVYPGQAFSISAGGVSAGPVTNLIVTATGPISATQIFTNGGPYALIYQLPGGATPGSLEQFAAYAVDSLGQTSATVTLSLSVGVATGQSSPVIYYSRAGSPDGQLWAAALDGSFDSPLIAGEQPRVSPSGRYLAFHKDNAQFYLGNVYVLDLLTGNANLLLANNSFIVGYGWSPDNGTLVFDFNCDIEEINLDGSNRQSLINANCYDDAPAINPLDGRVAFQNTQSGGGIGLANADGSNRHFIPNTTPGDVWSAWSADGQWISFQDGTNYFKIHPDGTGLTQLTLVPVAGDGFNGPGAWTPDGTSLVAAGKVNGVNGLYRVATDGSKTVSVIPTTAGAAIDFVGSVVAVPASAVPYAGVPLNESLTVNGSFSPANSGTAWKFAAQAGQQFGFKPGATSGFTSQGAPRWKLVDPLGNVLFDNSFTDPGFVSVPITGEYILLVYGSISETAATGSYSLQVQLTGNLPPSSTSGLPLTLGMVMSGNVSAALPVVYSFTLASPTQLIFDSLTQNSQLQWTLTSAGEHFVDNRSFNASDSSDINDASLALPAGQYQLTVGIAGSGTNAYQFQLLNFASATSLTPGTLESGMLSPANSTVLYQFTGNAGDLYYFNGQLASGFTYTPLCRLYGPLGNIILSQSVNGNVDTFTLPQTGTYTLTVEGRVYDTHASGNYAFNLVPEVYPTNTLTIGNTVSNFIAIPGQRQAYTFTLPAPATLYFDSLTKVDLLWRLDAPSGQIVNWRNFTSSDGGDISDPSLPLPAGNYTLTVAGDNTYSVTAGYQFRLIDFANATPFTPGTVVNGTLSPANSSVLYQFAGNAGDRYYFDGQLASGFSYTPLCRLYGPLGNIIISQNVNGNVDAFTLPQSGTYTLTVEGRVYDTHASGNYAFNLVPEVYPTNTLTIGNTVSNFIAIPGQRQAYTFTLPAPATLYFDSLTNVDLLWRLDAPWGQIVNWRNFASSDSADFSDPSLPLAAGNYTLTVAGDNTYSVTGGYQFRLLNFANATPFTPGTVVNGALSPANSSVLYQFTGNAGDRYYFNGQLASGFSYTPLCRLYGPLGNIIISQNVNGNVDTFTLPQSGTYTLTVEGRIYDTHASGNYAFNLVPEAYPTNSLTIGNTVSNFIAIPGQRQAYTFTLPTPATLYFDPLTNVDLIWRLDAPWGPIVNWRNFANSDGSSISDPSLPLPAGNYTLTVAGDNTYSVTGGYQFRLLNFANATPFAPGTVVNGTLSPANSTMLYQFTGNAGDLYYFNGQSASGFSYIPYCRLYGPLDNILFSLNVNGNVDTFALTQSGTYILTVEGQVYDTQPSGNYGFNLVPDPNAPPLPLIPTNVAPDLIVSGISVLPATGLQSGGLATVQWTDSDVGTGPVSSSFTDRITIRNTATGLVLADGFLPYNESDSGNGAIAPGDGRARQLALALPDGPNSAGTLQVTVTVDSQNNIPESNEANNSASANFTATLAPYPDLLVASVNTTPPTRWLPGSLVTINWQLTNSGTGSAHTNWADSVVILNTNTAQFIFTGATNYNLADPGNGPMAPGDFRNRSISFTMPSGANAYGFFSIIITTDSGNQVYEYNPQGSAELNNSTTIDVISAPDLVVQNLGFSAGLQSGGILGITWADANIGTVDTGGDFYDHVVVRNTGTSEVLADSTVHYDSNASGNGSIAPGDSRPRSFSVRLPDGPRGAGTLQIAVTTDSLNQLNEVNASGTGEANNTTTTTANSSIAPYPDLQVVNLNVQPPSLASGTNVTVSWQDTNSGNGLALGNWYDHVLVVNTNLGITLLDTTVYYNFASLGPLTNGNSIARSSGFTLPNGPSGVGGLLITVTVDTFNNIFEYNPAGTAESNNIASVSAASALAAYPDLQVINLGVQPGTLASGSNVTIHWQDTNTGNGPAAGSWYDHLAVVNTNLGLTLLDTTVYYDTNLFGPLTNGTSVNRSGSFTLPNGGNGAGGLLVTVTADVFNNIFEYNPSGTGESNNSASISAISSVSPYPDLQVVNLSVSPDVLASGANVTVHWQDTNAGNATASANWSDHLLVVNTNFGVTLLDTTVLYDTNLFGPLTNGTARDLSFSFALPNGSNGAGGLLFIVAADTFNSIFEYNPDGTGESNNSNSIVRLANLTPLPDLVITNLSSVSTVLSGQPLTAQIQLANLGLLSMNSTSILQRLFISTTASAGAGTLVGLDTYTGPLNIGQSITETFSFLAPSIPGTYWLSAQADSSDNVLELSEDNNTFLSPTPIVVQPAYTAVVTADVHSALANTPIPMHGLATLGGSGGPAAFVPVTIHVQVRGTDRTYTVLTGADGTFTNVFYPLPTEAGVYQIAAALPEVANPPAQDTFTLIGMTVDQLPLVDLITGTAVTNTTLLRNLSDVPLTSLSVVVVTNQPNLAVTATMGTNTLDSFATAPLNLSITAIDPSIYQSPVMLHITSAEGAFADLTVIVRVEALHPQLVATPGSLNGTMQLGAQKAVAFNVANLGGVATGPLQVVPPNTPWLSAASSSLLPPLQPGSNTVITLLLTPAADLPLGNYNGSLVLQSTNVALSVPFSFRAVSDSTGNMLVTAQDEYTYFAAGAPNVTNAMIVLTDALSGNRVATNFTGPDGTFLFTNLTEAYYIVDVTEPTHSPFRETALVPRGMTTNVVAFLPRQTVTYSFTVTPTTVADQYIFTIDSTFETQVPIPVLTIDPASLDLAQYPETQFQVLYTINNHGLIDSEDVKLSFPSTANLKITPLVTDLGKLKANGSLTVPVLFQRVSTPAPQGANTGPQKLDANSGTCSVTGEMLWNYLCGPNVVNKQTAAYVFDSTGCNLVDLYSQVYHLVPNNPPGSGTNALITSQQYFDYLNQLQPVSDFGPPPGYHFECNAAPGKATLARKSDLGQASPAPSLPHKSDVNSVCAHVKLSLDQRGVLTRDAFKATFDIDNTTTTELDNVQVALNVTDSSGTLVSSNFAIAPPSVSGLTGVDGTGVLPGNTQGQATWTIIPTLEAAPTNGMVIYLVGGSLSYSQGGTVVTIPLAPAPIEVFPQPELLVRYFHDRDVFADDPFTPQIEPSIPYSLAVQVNNVGYGPAQSLTMSSGQPQIVENIKGLIIGFTILGTQLENQQVTPSLSVDLGGIDPGTNKIARWLFSSTLQGSFTNFSASYSEVDSLGNPRLSLIRSVEIHELTHIVDAGGSYEDGRPDFLVNDIPDADLLPDTLYLSDGSIAPVTALTNATVNSSVSPTNLSVTISVAPTGGWAYFRFGDPGQGQYNLTRVLRSDNSEVPFGVNVWTTDRSFRGGDLVPIYTNLVHIFDYNSSGSYTLFYVSTNANLDVTPPTSSVAALPPASPPSFTVQWSGTDNPGGSGIGLFDIYVSVNGGPFAPWLTNTTLTASIYSGVAGNTYAFFSRATDVAGNQEALKTVAEAQTTSTTANSTPPAITPILTQTIAAGSLFTLSPSATDTTVPAPTLTWSLLAGPTGALIVPSTGQITWQTTPGSAANTVFTLVVSDNGSPSLSATQSFNVVVTQINHPPVILPFPLSVSVAEQTPLSVQFNATDPDLPQQTLTWQLGPGAPSGVSIDPGLGLLTWTPTPAQGPSTDLVTVIVRDNGTPSLSDTGVLAIVVVAPSVPPTLAPISNRVAFVFSPLVVTNFASEPSAPGNILTFTLGPGAPAGAAINPSDGVFTWTPSADQAATTNIISVIVTDNGVPPLSATQQFTVIVRSQPFDFILRLGSTNLFVGESNSVPVVLQSFLALTNITAVLQVPHLLLTNLTLQSASPEAQVAVLHPSAQDTYSLNLLLDPSQVSTNTRLVANLGFVAVPQLNSAIVPLLLSQPAGGQKSGQPITKPGVSDGQIIIVGRQPVLLASWASDYTRDLTLYGRLGASYEIQYSFGLTGWTDWMRVPMTGRADTFHNLDASGAATFYRAYEFIANPPELDWWPANQNQTLIAYGAPGTNYLLQFSTNLAAAAWYPLSSYTLSNSFQFFSNLPNTSPTLFYRINKP